LGTVIDTQQINNLPVNGRLFQTLMFLAPGTTPAAWGDQIENPAAAGSTAPGGGGAISSGSMGARLDKRFGRRVGVYRNHIFPLGCASPGYRERE
jgi:hypothetical protein